MVECGPEGSSSTCPSSHKCHLSPLGRVRYAMTSVTLATVRVQFVARHFNPETNQCQTFRYGGCDGNLNNFETEEECWNACPSLTPCERMREKNIRHAGTD
ncbi:hypothetical protein Pcinc_026477 [Petrolisthes cinctipes]|uniref:BPTI/Kunitz inhibitor domain-containing protein n=1 Tax=Petrolisthes cinctipes TaxID=88211 RepID=A0AAE1F787_PETCI|nr:hypothetical protein Pcinc_026477 [Petrolisthes cinctipes]